MKKILLIVLMFSFMVPAAFSQIIKAKTEDGKDVYLFGDGTWKYNIQISVSKSPFLLPIPPFEAKTIEGKSSPKAFGLKKFSSIDHKHGIGNIRKWFKENSLELPLYTVPNPYIEEKGNCPDRTPLEFKGIKLAKAIYSQDYNYLVYGNNLAEGRYLVVADKEMKKILHVLDFKNYIQSPGYEFKDYSFFALQISWAIIQNNILYISHSHRTYADFASKNNAYVTAIDLTKSTYPILWRSKPLVCNSHNFIIKKDIIFTGFGSTSTNNFIYQLDKNTGKIVGHTKIGSIPFYLIEKSNKLYVNTLSTNYIFNVLK